MSGKNVKNSSGYTTLNFNSSAGPTGATGPMGGTSTYLYSGLIPLVWDRDDLLQGGPYNSNIICEKIGNMLFVKILETITGTPQGGAALFWSPTGIVPAAYRPATKSFSVALVANGFQDGLPILNMTYGYSTILGGCFLDIDGTLSFGTSQGPRVGPLTTDGLSLYSFSGPNICGIVKQTLCFNLE